MIFLALATYVSSFFNPIQITRYLWGSFEIMAMCMPESEWSCWLKAPHVQTTHVAHEDRFSLGRANLLNFVVCGLFLYSSSRADKNANLVTWGGGGPKFAVMPMICETYCAISPMQGALYLWSKSWKTDSLQRSGWMCPLQNYVMQWEQGYAQNFCCTLLASQMIWAKLPRQSLTHTQGKLNNVDSL